MKPFAFLGLIVVTAVLMTGNARAQSAPADTNTFRIGKIAFAITNVDAMVDFYRNVFSINFRAIDIGDGMKLYSGKLGDLNLLLAPNALAGVKAEQSLMQFDVIVADLEVMKARTVRHGGTVREENENERQKIATVVDPDGNTIVLIEEK